MSGVFEDMRNAVLGAGITGLSCAAILQDAGESVTIFESEKKAGGLARSLVKDGFVFDFAGGHVFNTKWADIKKWVFRYLAESEWQYNIRYCKVWYSKKTVTDYPFELGLHKLPIDEAIECLSDFFEQQVKKEPEPDNLHDWFIWRFGKAIADKYLIPYNHKIWGIAPKDLSPIWVQGKMPLPSAREILTAVLKKDSNEDKTAHSRFYYPKKDGIQSWIDSIANTLTELKLENPVVNIEKVSGGWKVNGEGVFNRVISTIPLPELAKVLGKAMPPTIDSQVKKLRYNSWTATYYDYDLTNAIEEFVSWIYLPGREIHSNKFSNYASYALGNAPSGHSNMLVDNVGIHEVDFITKDAKKYLPNLGSPLAMFHTKYAYVVYDYNYAKATKIIRDWFKDYGVVLLGRFGRWDYSNMDVCIRQVFDWAQEVGLKKKESQF